MSLCKFCKPLGDLYAFLSLRAYLLKLYLNTEPMEMMTTSPQISNQSSTSSFEHKLHRIQKEEHFKEENQHIFETLTNREVEILYLLANDKNNPQIADELFISRFTVEQHRKNINRKLGANSYGQLFRFGLL